MKNRTTKRSVLFGGMIHRVSPFDKSSMLKLYFYSFDSFAGSASSATAPSIDDLPVIDEFSSGFPFEILTDCDAGLMAVFLELEGVLDYSADSSIGEIAAACKLFGSSLSISAELPDKRIVAVWFNSSGLKGVCSGVKISKFLIIELARISLRFLSTFLRGFVRI